jgi:hypothetical protein
MPNLWIYVFLTLAICFILRPDVILKPMIIAILDLILLCLRRALEKVRAKMKELEKEIDKGK